VLAGPTIRRRRLGADLRRLREASSLKLEDVAERLGVAQSTLSRIETGKAPTRTSYLAIMLDLYGVTDQAQRTQFTDLAREGQRKGWWTGFDELLPAGMDRYLGLEAEASAVLAYQLHLVPGLLQTEDYARAVIAAARPDLRSEQAERLVRAQLKRQQVLLGGEFRLHVVLDESVLFRSMGPAVLMRAQLGHLAAAAASSAVTLQVLALATAARAAPPGSFAIVTFAEPGDADVLCAGGPGGQILLDERAAEVRAMRVIFERLCRSALSPGPSARLIKELARSS